jgi:hypothetical protein
LYFDQLLVVTDVDTGNVSEPRYGGHNLADVDESEAIPTDRFAQIFAYLETSGKGVISRPELASKLSQLTSLITDDELLDRVFVLIEGLDGLGVDRLDCDVFVQLVSFFCFFPLCWPFKPISKKFTTLLVV